MNNIQRMLADMLSNRFCLSNVTTVAIPLCLGDPRDEQDGCWSRFFTAVKGLKSDRTLTIQTGGTQENPLCSKMRSQLLFRDEQWAAGFLCPVLGWGTRAEIKNAFMIIRQLDRALFGQDGIDTKSSDFKVVISSNWLHLWRIRWFVYLYNMDKIQVEYRVAHHPFTLWSKIREILGTPCVVLSDIILKGVRQSRIEALYGFYNTGV